MPITAPEGTGQKPILLVAAIALVDADGRVLIAQRPKGKHLEGLWEFPGGKLRQGETPEAALIRELKEELGIDVAESCLAPLSFASHAYEEFHLLMPLYVCRIWQGAVSAREGQQLKWVRPSKLGDWPMPPADAPLVAALRDSIFQGELLMSQGNFLRLFPEQEGYRLLLVETAPEQAAMVAADIEGALTDFGADATGTAARLAEFHRVENTYLSTFQTLGGLGLLLGTIGLATVLLRNVLERRRELALLGAVGYRRTHFLLMVAAENTLLLAGGLIAGAVCAGLAIAPAVVERGGRVPLTSGAALLLFAVFVTGLLSSLIAVRVATGAPLLEALRSE